MSSKVGGIARAPVWGANPFLNNNNSNIPPLRTVADWLKWPKLFRTDKLQYAPVQSQDFFVMFLSLLILYGQNNTFVKHQHNYMKRIIRYSNDYTESVTQ